jgi:hypothetical protein
MKKNSLLIILILIFQTSLYAQTSECQYDKNEVDKFTNKKVIWTKWEHLSPLITRDYAPDVRCTVEDTVKQLLFYINGYWLSNDKPTQAGIDNYLIVPQGSKTILLMEDGKTVELIAEQEFHSTGDYMLPRSNGNATDQFRINYHLALMYKLNDNVIKTLGGQGATGIRIYYKSENYHDYTIGKKKYATIQTLMKCIQ